jgi:hypothetical protein
MEFPLSARVTVALWELILDFMFIIVVSSCCAILGLGWVLLFFVACLFFSLLCVSIHPGLGQVLIGLQFLLLGLDFVSSFFV